MVNKKKKKKPSYQNESWEDTYFQDAQDSLDQNTSKVSAIAGLIGVNLVVNSIKPSGPVDNPVFKNFTHTVTDIPKKELADTFNLNIDVKVYNYVYHTDEIKKYQQLAEELKHHGRIEDPRTIENLSFRNSSMISDRLGMFGEFESFKTGQLDVYKILEATENVIVLIPFENLETGGEEDEKTCEECWELIYNSPYPPDEFPEPPHFGCRHGPGEPIIVQVPLDETGDNLITLIYLPYKCEESI